MALVSHLHFTRKGEKHEYRNNRKRRTADHRNGNHHDPAGHRCDHPADPAGEDDRMTRKTMMRTRRHIRWDRIDESNIYKLVKSDDKHYFSTDRYSIAQLVQKLKEEKV